MIRILVTDPLADEGLKRIEEMDGVEADVKTGLSEDELAAVAGQYDGMIIRSGVTITDKVLANPGQLRVIARAGVGVDNVDLAAATQAGVLVMNTPDANTISTAEQTLALMLAMSRHVAKADVHVRSGEWKRKAFVGTQLAAKTLGVVGFGRVGRAVALRAYAFDMKVVAYDPFFTGDSALDGKVTMVGSLDEVFAQADYLTLHTVITDETKGLINSKTIGKMKDGVRIVNCARGGLINEADLAAALESGKVAAAAVDVYSAEPPGADNPLLKAPNIVLAPHLGASTEEAQLAVTVDAVDALLDYLVNDRIRWAVNVTGLPAQMTQRDRAYMDLAQRMGTILSKLCTGGIKSVSVVTHDESLDNLAKVLCKQVLVDLLSPHLTTRLNLINVDDIAKARGITVGLSTDTSKTGLAESLLARVETREGTHEIVGEVFQDGRPRIMALDGYQMNLEPEGGMVLIFNNDEPGVIGLVGKAFGEAKINIADLTLSHREKTAKKVLKIDGPRPDAVIDNLRGQKPQILEVLPIRLPPILKS